jgi:hypothetical protein
MDKNRIKSHLHSFLAEADKKHVGLSATEKVQKQEKDVNKDYYKEVTKKMGEYDKESTDDGDSISKGKLEKTDSEEMDVNPNGMDQIQYDNEPTERFKQRAIDALEGTSQMGNKTYTGAENGNTEEVWGASGGKHTGKEIVKAAKAVSKKDARPQEDAVGYVPSPTKTKLATENKVKNNEIIKESKMKRLKFNESFNGLGGALQKIPAKYKVDNKVFEMTDGNENYRIKWEGSLTEGEAVVLIASDKKMMNEDIQHMKHLMGFKAENTLGTPSAKDRLAENTTFRDIMNMTNTILTEGADDGDRTPINETAFAGGAGMGFSNEGNLEGNEPIAEMEKEIEESEEVTENEEVTESKSETPAAGGEASKIGSTANGDPRGAGHDKHVMETEEVTEGDDLSELEDVTEAEEVMEGFESPAVFTIAEADKGGVMNAGTDLGTDIGKTASGEPRGDGHDKHVMETEETKEDCDNDDDDDLKKESY